MRFIFFGDVVGRIGRQAINRILPYLKSKFKPDFVFANGDNLAHGKGFTIKTLKQILAFGVDGLTGGNHFFDKKEQFELLRQENLPIIPPANWPGLEIKPWLIFEKRNCQILLFTLLGREFMGISNVKLASPFDTALDILKKIKPLPKIIILDFHAETTSEKKALAFWLEGKVSAVLGSHTHVQTADEQILPQGTSFISDLGMVGAKQGILGIKKEPVIHYFNAKEKEKHIPFEVIEKGQAIVNGLFLDIDQQTGKTKRIERINQELNIL